MTIENVLNTDWTVDRIDITVRDRKTTKYIMRYCIGRDVEPGRSERFAYDAEIGAIYKNSEMKTLFIKRIIQFRQMERRPNGKELCVGVLIKEIPEELLVLEIDHMYPYHCGYSDDMHGYRFVCYVDAWDGINGENKQIEFQELMEV